jgi:hypothetical protein
MMFKIGDRVRISEKYHYAQGATGTVAYPLDGIVELCQDSYPWEGCRRTVQGANGPIEFHWVIFDEPQDDGSGDGLDQGAQIKTSMLRHI